MKKKKKRKRINGLRDIVIYCILYVIREMFACEIRNPGLWNSEYNSRNPESPNDWNPDSKFH